MTHLVKLNNTIYEITGIDEKFGKRDPIKMECSKCGDSIIKYRKVKNPVCFNCKMKRINSYYKKI